MPTSNIPLTYAVQSDNTIHLYVVIYAGSQPDFEEGEASGNTMLFVIEKGDTGSTKYFKHYSFDVDTFTNIEVRCDNHIRKIAIADLDNDSTPDQSGDRAFEVPYTYTQVQNTNSFEVELVVFSSTDQQFTCSHGAVPGSLIGDTESAITVNSTAPPVKEFSSSHVFTVQNVLLTDGGHQATTQVGSPPRTKKTKTKNKNHSIAPFPG